MAIPRITFIILFFMAEILFLKPSSCALIPSIFISDVTPVSFTVNSTFRVLTQSDILVFSSPEANNDITDQLQVNRYPLYGYSDDVHSVWKTRQEKETIRQRMKTLKHSQISFSGCMPATTYFFSVSSDQQIYSVTTALYNQFIYHAPQLIVHFPSSHNNFNPNGYLIIAQSPLAMYPVSAIVGDGRPEHAIVNLCNMFDTNGLSLNTNSGIDVQVVAQGAQLTPVSSLIHLNPSETFDVANSYSILFNSPPTYIPIEFQQFSENQQHQFTLKANDHETVAGQLNISVQSSNPELIPNENITVSYTGTDYVVSVEPALFQSGSASITLNISDSYNVTWTTFQINVQPIANTPLISYISPLHGREDSSVLLSFGIELMDNDGSEVLENICLNGLPHGGKISAPAIFEDPCWTLETTDDHFLRYLPPENDHTDFNLIVSYQSRELENNDIAAASTSIKIIMEPVNDPPMISKCSDMVMNENTISQPIAFTVVDIDHASSELQVSVSSNLQSLFPQSSFQIQGTESERYLTIQPAPHQSGQGEIVITVSDGEWTDESRFMVNVIQYQPELLGDLNGDGILSLDDLIIALQVTSNMNPHICYPSASIDSVQIMIDDALYIIFELSGIVYHSGDYNPSDLKINLNEILRLIQLHNAGGYHCDSNSEDGYAPEQSEILNQCPYHSSDFVHDGIFQDWVIDDFELNRFIQFYNAGGYVPDKESVDGFRPR